MANTSNLDTIIKISRENYETLINGGTVGGYTYDPEAMYLVKESDKLISGTYEQIKDWRDNGLLVAGALYRMTDYVTKIYSEDESVGSAEHPFDLILFADSPNSFNENALAMVNENDSYFSQLFAYKKTYYKWKTEGDPDTNYIPCYILTEQREYTNTPDGHDGDGNYYYTTYPIDMYLTVDEESWEMYSKWEIQKKSILYTNGNYLMIGSFLSNEQTYKWYDDQAYDFDGTYDEIVYKTANLNAWRIKYTIDNNDSRFDFGVVKNAEAASFKIKNTYDGEYVESGFDYTPSDIKVSDLTYGQDIERDYPDFTYVYGCEDAAYYEFAISSSKEIKEGDLVLYCEGNGDSLGKGTAHNIKTQGASEDGKGIIYYMKDEFNNEAPYDFKNIIQTDYEYTFGKGLVDYSLEGYVNGVYNNKILPQVDSETGKQTINRIRVTEKDCHTNLFKPTCVNSYINFPISECDISMNNDGELVVFKTADFISGIENNEIHVDYNNKYRREYLTIEAIEDDTDISFIYSEGSDWEDAPANATIYYSINDGEWTSVTFRDSWSSDPTTITINQGDKVRFKGRHFFSSGYEDSRAHNIFRIYSPCYVYGNIMSLIGMDNFDTLDVLGDKDRFAAIFEGDPIRITEARPLVLPATALSSYCYCGMFGYCTSLEKAPDLPATKLAYDCYDNMFIRCTSLESAPELPATTLAGWCYYSMFGGCSSLSEAPVLPATKLENSCYSSMFWGCSGLETAPELPATNLENFCYNQMFSGCINLIESPSLQATELKEGCYYYMFNGCTKLTETPELPATDLENSCYEFMFSGCTGLTTVKVLSATGLARSCYSYMFASCTSLATTPLNMLQAANLEQDCYSNMFRECTNLTAAPDLPATALTTSCYSNMFYGCSNLETAPDLPAPNLVNYCYQSMFRYCTNLKYIKCLTTNKNATNCTSNWVQGVQTTQGTFVKHPNMSVSAWGRGNNGIPQNWDPVDNV